MDFREILEVIAKAVKKKETVEIYYPETESSLEGWREVIPFSLTTDIPPDGEVLVYGKDRLSPGHIFNAYLTNGEDKEIRSFIIGKIKFARSTKRKHE